MTPESFTSNEPVMIRELPPSASAGGYPSSSTSFTDSTGTNMGDSHDGNESDPGSSGLGQTVMPLTIQSPVPRTQAPLDRFEAYIEDTLGLYAPSFKQVTTNPSPQSDTDLEGLTGSRRLEVEMASRQTVELERHMASLDAADMELLRAKGAFNLPPRDLQEELIHAHFAEVHPTAPVINKSEFLSEFYSNRMPSRLLLFAVLASGSRACRNPALLDDKGTVHSSAQRFYKATKVSLSPRLNSSILLLRTPNATVIRRRSWTLLTRHRRQRCRPYWTPGTRVTSSSVSRRSCSSHGGGTRKTTAGET